MKVKKTGLYIDSEDYSTLLDVVTPVLKGNYDVELTGNKCTEESDIYELCISPLSVTDVQYRNAKSFIKYSLHALKRTFKQNRKYKQNRRKCTKKLLSHLSRNSESHGNVIDLSSITRNVSWNISYSINYNDTNLIQRVIKKGTTDSIENSGSGCLVHDSAPECIDQCTEKHRIGECIEKATGTDCIDKDTKLVQTENTGGISVGYNISPICNGIPESDLRPIIIDGSNVAYSHGKHKEFSFEGLRICIEFFKNRGHKVIASLPNFRKASVANKGLLRQWEGDGTLAIIPSRRINNRLVICDEDRFVIQAATNFNGVIISLDQFRDYLGENPLWDVTIKERLLMFTWLEDQIVFPQDPLGSDGPTLDDFLKF